MSKHKKHHKRNNKSKNKNDAKKRKLKKLLRFCITAGCGIINTIGSILTITSIYYNMHSEYNQNPKVAMVGNPQRNKFLIELSGKNNLRDIVVITSDKSPVYIKYEGVSAEAIEKDLENIINDGNFDLETDNWNYKYKFIVLKGIDDYSIYTAIVKSKKVEEKNMVEQLFLDKHGMYELENVHIDDPDFEGERIISKQYKEIVDYYK